MTRYDRLELCIACRAKKVVGEPCKACRARLDELKREREDAERIRRQKKARRGKR